MRRFNLIPLTLLVLLVGCVNEPETETFEVFPRSLELTQVGQDSVQLFVNIDIGPNLCYKFLYPRSEIQGGIQRIRFIAERPTPNSPVTCLQQLSHLEDTISIVRMPNINTFKIGMNNGKDTLFLIQ